MPYGVATAHFVKTALRQMMMCSISLSFQYKHNGKARRGDGNDITPSPQKLLAIGKELKGLNRIINELTPVSELPVTIRPRSRKEKNKLASRWVDYVTLLIKLCDTVRWHCSMGNYDMIRHVVGQLQWRTLITPWSRGWHPISHSPGPAMGCVMCVWRKLTMLYLDDSV